MYADTKNLDYVILFVFSKGLEVFFPSVSLVTHI